MTNGEKIQTILDVDRDCIEVHGENGTMTFTITQEWWNAECNEPSTPNDCETCIHNKGVLECDMYGCKYEPTAKNDLAVDAVSRQAINGYIDYILSHGMGKKKSFDFIKKFVANLPPVTPQKPKIRHCKNCKFFELNSWAACGGIPIIVAHEICKAWGEGCKTKIDGYCFLFEPKESEGKE